MSGSPLDKNFERIYITDAIFHRDIFTFSFSSYLECCLLALGVIEYYC